MGANSTWRSIAYQTGYSFVVHCTACFGFFTRAEIFETSSAMYLNIVFESDYRFDRQYGGRILDVNIKTN